MFLTGQLLGNLQVDRPNPFLPCLSIWMTRKKNYTGGCVTFMGICPVKTWLPKQEGLLVLVATQIFD